MMTCPLTPEEQFLRVAAVWRMIRDQRGKADMSLVRAARRLGVPPERYKALRERERSQYFQRRRELRLHPESFIG